MAKKAKSKKLKTDAGSKRRRRLAIKFIDYLSARGYHPSEVLDLTVGLMKIVKRHDKK